MVVEMMLAAIQREREIKARDAALVATARRASRAGTRMIAARRGRRSAAVRARVLSLLHRAGTRPGERRDGEMPAQAAG